MLSIRIMKAIYVYMCVSGTKLGFMQYHKVFQELNQPRMHCFIKNLQQYNRDMTETRVYIMV